MQGFSGLDRKTWAAIYRLNAPEMEPVLTLLKNLANETDRALRRAESDKFARLQGRAGLLEEFLAAVEQSAATLEKLK